jgi:hypothetical protein
LIPTSITTVPGLTIASVISRGRLSGARMLKDETELRVKPTFILSDRSNDLAFSGELREPGATFC